MSKTKSGEQPRIVFMEHVGDVKYIVSWHDGVKVHSDGSPFYDIQTFKNKKKMQRFYENKKKELGI